MFRKMGQAGWMGKVWLGLGKYWDQETDRRLNGRLYGRIVIDENVDSGEELRA